MRKSLIMILCLLLCGCAPRVPTQAELAQSDAYVRQTPQRTEVPDTDALSERTLPPAAAYYIGNRNSKKVHLPTCISLPAEENRVVFDTLEEALAQGYVRCKRCLGE